MLKNIKIGSKIVLITIIGVVLLSVLLSAVSIVRMNILAKDVSSNVLREKLLGDLNSMNKYINEYYGSLSLSNNTIVDKEGNSIENHFEMIDNLSKDLGIVATIFVKDKNDFKRITTSITKDDGSRAVGTMLGTESAAYSEVIAGNLYIGQAVILNNTYVTGYKPLMNNKDVYGILFVGIPQKSVNSLISKSIYVSLYYLIGLTIVSVLVLIFLLFFFLRIFLKPLRDTSLMIKDIAEGEGDLTKRLSIDSQDEMGELSSYFNIFIDKIHKIVLKIVQEANELNKKSFDLAKTADNLVKNSIEMNSQSQLVSASSEEISSNANVIASAAEQSSVAVSTVAAATEQLSANINQVAEASTQTSKNVSSTVKEINNLENDIVEAGQSVTGLVEEINSIASALEEMNTTLVQISKNTMEASGISEKASNEAKIATKVMLEMQTLSNEIGKVVKLINDIADQTNMLALNATIEAASAGDAGKGFAVVANEVKILAKQTAEATANIASQIENVQKSAANSNMSISAIANIIDKLNEINTVIASSIEEQNITTREITHSSSRMSGNANDVQKRIAKVVDYSKSISNHANEATLAVNEISKNSHESAISSHEIANNSAQANQGVQEITRNTLEISQGIQEVAKSIASMLHGIESTTKDANNTKQASDELAKLSKELNDMVSVFKV